MGAIRQDVDIIPDYDGVRNLGNSNVAFGTLFVKNIVQADSGGPITQPSAPAVTAAGTNLAGSTQLAAESNYATTVASGTGVKLPDVLNTLVVVANGGANSLLVYPPTAAAKINTKSVGVAVTLTTTQIGFFIQVAQGIWIAGTATQAS